MKIAYFDCFSGISGDMILGALVDAGADFETLREHLHTLPVDGYRIERRVVRKHEIAGVKIDVRIETAPGVEVVEGPGDDTPFHASSHETVHDHAAHHTFPPSAHGHGHPPHDHGHVHTHPDEPVLEEHDHDVAHAHPHTHEHTHPHDGHRHLAELVGLIRTSGLNPSIKDRAIEIFDLLAEAEGVVHGIPRDQVHLHEVSGKDAIIDVVGACIGLDLLGIDTVYASPLPLGTGFIRCAHGRMPVPSPGALELLRGIPVYQTHTRGELVTPTGAAFLKAVANGFGPMPAMTLERVGYGAGAKDFPEHPNLLRACIGTS